MFGMMLNNPYTVNARVYFAYKHIILFYRYFC